MKKKLLLLQLVVALLAMTTYTYSQTWNEVMKVVASERAEEDRFGNSVSISGHYAIVGAQLESEDASDENYLMEAGSAFIFEKDNEGYWNLVQKIVASDRGEWEEFGGSVCISGNYAIVGAIYEDEDASGGNAMSSAGAAYIFKRDEQGQWVQIQKIVSSDRVSGDKFGSSVSMSGDYAFVGAPDINSHEDGFTRDAGAVYIFEKDEQDNWNEVQKMYGDPHIPNQHFGQSCDISGSYSVIGADEDAGVAYFFERDGSGTWNRVGKLVGPSYTGWKEFDKVSISGNYAIGGTSYDHFDEQEANSLQFAGSAFIFERDGSGNWDVVQKIVASDRADGDRFGESVTISGDMIIVGAAMKSVWEGEENYYHWAGAAYVFTRNGNGVWEETAKLSASDFRDGNTFGLFGNATAISGNYALIGSCLDNEDDTGENPLNEAGSAYIFSFCSAVSNNISEAICNGDSILLGGGYQLASGTFYDTLRASTGCDSIVATDLTVNVVDTALSVSDATLTANAVTGSYQWIDCATNQNIEGETNQSYTPSTGGSYAVVCTQDACVDTSSCYAISFVGIEDIGLSASVKVYPNPANNMLNIEMGKEFEVIDVRILNILGKEVVHKRFEKEQLLKVNIAELPAGPYFIHIQTPEGNAVLRVVKNE